MAEKVFNNEIDAWDSYAAAALSAAVSGSDSPEQAVAVASQLADQMLEQRRLRQKAASDYLGS